MEAKEAKEIIRAGFAWANWTEEQKEAFKLAYNAIDKVEELEKKVKSLQKQLDAKLVFINNGWEEERYLLEHKVERYEKALEAILFARRVDLKNKIAKAALED